jgi:endonuclease-3 related protein
LVPDLLEALPEEELSEIIRPAGYYRVKAARIKNLLDFLRQAADYDLNRLAREPVEELRPRLLQVKGIGPETADSILLYALHLPVFVVDAYTARIMHRHAMVPEDVGYAELQELFTDNLPQDVALFNEYHALFVRVGKGWCKKSEPLCSGCPLQTFK